jgi:hypothetical protein
MALDTPYLQVQISANLTGTTLEGGTPAYPFNATWAAPLTTGTGANQADKLYTASITLSASSGQDIDLAGVLTDPFGGALTMVKLKAVAIRASTANTNNVNISRPASNGVPWFLAASDGISLGPGGIFLFVNPGASGIATVTPATGDLLRVDNSGAGTSVTFDIVILGTSA